MARWDVYLAQTVERQTLNREIRALPCRKLEILFVNPTLPVSFGRDTVDHWFLLVPMPGDVKDPMQELNV